MEGKIVAARDFVELKQEICALLDTPVPPPQGHEVMGEEADAMTLLIENVPVVLSYSANLRKDRAFLLCVFGQVPADIESMVLRRLLETNFLTFRGNAPTFVREPVNGTILLMMDVPYEGTTSEGLLSVMRMFAMQAKAWRETYFIEDQVQFGGSFASPGPTNPPTHATRA